MLINSGDDERRYDADEKKIEQDRVYAQWLSASVQYPFFKLRDCSLRKNHNPSASISPLPCICFEMRRSTGKTIFFLLHRTGRP